MEISISAAADGESPVDLLAAASGLSKTRVKTVMTRGAVWLLRGGTIRRLRRAKAALRQNDQVTMWYSEALIDTVAPQPEKLIDEGAWSVWFKPAGLLSSGSRYGDHCAINRVVEQSEDRPVFLVHRLDAQTEGLMVLAHSKQSAAALSRAFSERRVRKRYTAEVEGSFSPDPVHVETPIDGQAAETFITLARTSEASSIVECRPVTGRKHQVRIHLAGLGHPLVGDRLYGSTAKPPFRLTAHQLEFPCPTSGEFRTVNLPPRLNQFEADQ